MRFGGCSSERWAWRWERCEHELGTEPGIGKAGPLLHASGLYEDRLMAHLFLDGLLVSLHLIPKSLAPVTHHT